MKRIIVIISLFITIQLQAQTYDFYRVDTLDSKVYWKCDKHNGKMNLKDGGFVVKNAIIQKGLFYLDMQSIKDLDMNPKQFGTAVLILENTIKNEFFEVEKYPLVMFDMQEVLPLKGGKYQITGDFTLHGITNCVSFVARIKMDDKTLHFTSETFKLDRTDWGIYRMSPKRPYQDDENGWTVSDTLEIRIELTAKKEK